MSTHDALVAPVWFAVNMLLITAAWRAASRMFPGVSFFEGARHTIVLCLACVVGTGIALGAVGILSAPALLGAVTAVALPVFWALRPRGSAGDETPPLSDSEEHRAGETNAASLSRFESWCWVGWGAWAALAAGRVVVSGLLEYPSNWDTLTYHLPFVDQWLQGGNLYVAGAAKWFFPGNSELIGLWMVAPFSGDFFGPLNNAPWVALLLLSAVELARTFRVATFTRHLGALVLVSNYVVWHQMMDNKNDVAAASLLLSCLVYAFHYATDSRRADLVLAAMCLGMLAGVKYYALGYAGAALVAIVVLTASTRGKREAILAATICLAGLILWGGY